MPRTNCLRQRQSAGEQGDFNLAGLNFAETSAFLEISVSVGMAYARLTMTQSGADALTPAVPTLRSSRLQRVVQIRDAAGFPGLEDTWTPNGNVSIFLHDQLIPYRPSDFGPYVKSKATLIARFCELQSKILDRDKAPGPPLDDRFGENAQSLGSRRPEINHISINNYLERYENRGRIDENGAHKIEEVKFHSQRSQCAFVLKKFEKPTTVSCTHFDKTRKAMDRFDTEIRCIARCNHIHLIRYVESFTDQQYLGIIVWPRAEMNLRSFMDGDYPEGYDSSSSSEHLRGFHGCLLRAMAYLARKGITHRDIKPQNMLVRFEREELFTRALKPQILICDFGLSRLRERDEPDTMDTFAVGTFIYKAPELHVPGSSHGETTDVWSLGCVFIEINMCLNGWSLEDFHSRLGHVGGWNYASKRLAVEKYMDEDPDGRVAPPALDSETRRELMRFMLSRNKDDRLSFGKLEKIYCRNRMITATCCLLSSDSTELENISETPTQASLTNRLRNVSLDGRGQPLVREKHVKRLALQHREKDPNTTGKYEEWQTKLLHESCDISLHSKVPDKPWQLTHLITINEQEDLWLPFSFINTQSSSKLLTIYWSDCLQETLQASSDPYTTSTVYKWEHVPRWPNWCMKIEFEADNDNLDFIAKLCHIGANRVFPPLTNSHNPLYTAQIFSDIWSTDDNRSNATHGYYAILRIRQALWKGTTKRDIRLVFVPKDLDIDPEESRGNDMINLTFLGFYEPWYRSNHPSDTRPWPKTEVTPDTPTCRLLQTFSLQFPYHSIQDTDGLSRPEHLIFLNALHEGSWRCRWYGHFETLRKKRIKGLIGKTSKDGLLMVWVSQDKHETRFVFRLGRTSSDFKYPWLVVSGSINDGDYNYNDREITFESKNYCEGNLLRLKRSPKAVESFNGKAIVPSTASPRTWTLRLRSEGHRTDFAVFHRSLIDLDFNTFPLSARTEVKGSSLGYPNTKTRTDDKPMVARSLTLEEDVISNRSQEELRCWTEAQVSQSSTDARKTIIDQKPLHEGRESMEFERKPGLNVTADESGSNRERTPKLLAKCSSTPERPESFHNLISESSQDFSRCTTDPHAIGPSSITSLSIHDYGSSRDQPLQSLPGECREDDTASDVGTLYSTGSSTDGDVKEYYMNAFVSVLMDGLSREGFVANAETMPKLKIVMPLLLKDFGGKLAHANSTQIHRRAMVFITRYRSELTDIFITACDPSPDSNTEPDMSPEEKIEASASRQSIDASQDFIREDFETTTISRFEMDHGDEATDNGAEREDEIDIDDNGESEALTNLKDAVVGSSSQRWLTSRINRCASLSFPEDGWMANISRTVRQAFKSTIGYRKVSRRIQPPEYVAKFEIDWNPIKFLQEQEYQGSPEDCIERVITLTGSANEVQATLALQYLSQTWPLLGESLLQLLAQMVRSESISFQECRLEDKTLVTARMADSLLLVETIGTESSAVETAELFGWLGAALRASPTENTLTVCCPKITSHNDEDDISFGKQSLRQQNPLQQTVESRFKVGFTFEPFRQGDFVIGAHCWKEMFLNPTIVKGYPIMHREADIYGLEIPLKTMMDLVQTTKITWNQRLPILKGFSAMIVPIQLRGDCLQWHLLFNKDKSRISYNDSRLRGIERDNLDKIRTIDLEVVRHFVGWCRQVDNVIGTLDAEYSISASGLPRTGKGCVLEKVSITCGKFVTVGLSAAIGNKDKGIMVRNRDDYLRQIRWAATRFVSLVDVEKRRSWLIDGAAALLYLVLSSIKYLQQHKVFKNLLLFKWEELQQHREQWPPEDRALAILSDETNMDQILYKNPAERWEEETIDEAGNSSTITKSKRTHILFSQKVRETYSILEQIVDRQEEAASADGVRLNLRKLPNRQIEGFDFIDIGGDCDPIEPYVHTLHDFGKGWVDFIEEISAVALFGKGFGDIIQPACTNGYLCSHWPQVPNDKDYLAVCVPTINRLLREENTCKAPWRIVNDIYWHTPGKTFEPCECDTVPSRTICDRVQVLLPMTCQILWGSNFSSPSYLEQRGGLIFGHRFKVPFRWSRDRVDSSQTMILQEQGNSEESRLPAEDAGSEPAAESTGSEPAPDSGLGSSLVVSPSDVLANEGDIGSPRPAEGRRSTLIPTAYHTWEAIKQSFHSHFQAADSGEAPSDGRRS